MKGVFGVDTTINDIATYCIRHCATAERPTNKKYRQQRNNII